MNLPLIPMRLIVTLALLVALASIFHSDRLLTAYQNAQSEATNQRRRGDRLEQHLQEGQRGR